MFDATFSNISAILWRPVLVMEEAGVPGENHRQIKIENWNYSLTLMHEMQINILEVHSRFKY